MCGIIAMVGSEIPDDSRAVDAALDALSRRGPNDRGVMRFTGAVLGQTRLSIIDLSPTGHQPMRDRARAIAITFNGEIYNYRELRKELAQKGHQFHTQSDTEVILKSYLEFGAGCATALDGMFAFALWDDDQRQLFLARDRFGKKPLYYAFDARGTLIIASEIKALFAAGVVGEIDPAGIDAYLTLMYIPPWRSVYKNVHVLLPGHTAVYRDGTLSTDRYWRLEPRPTRVSYGEAKEEVRRLFAASVKKRMIADVEIGAFLSGGVDSTLVTAYAQRISTHPVKTFSVGYGDHINELPFAKQASERIGTDHYALQATSELTDDLERVVSYFDEPHADTSNMAQHLVSQLASTKVRVALSGDGADELFLGYRWYQSYSNASRRDRLRNLFLSSPYAHHVAEVTVFNAERRRDLWIDPAAMQHEAIDQLVAHARGNGMAKMNLFDITTYLPGQLLSKADMAGMMHSLEVRCPFLDYQLAEFAYGLPTEFKSTRTGFKLILKDLLGEIMPAEFVERRKQGFGAPMAAWFQTPRMQAYAKRKLQRGAKLYAFLREDRVRTLLDGVCAGNPHDSTRLWLLLCLQLWLDRG